MKYNKISYVFIILLVAISILVIFVLPKNTSSNKKDYWLQVNNGQRLIGVWDEDTLLFFLPSYVSMSDVSLVTEKTNQVVIDNQTGADLSVLSLNELYSMTSLQNESECVWVKFLKSENSPALFINIASGGTKIIHQSKLYSENAAISLYSSTGVLEYSSNTDTINSRGNTSWNAEKKPYMICMTNPQGILDMKAASKWILLASPYDETCMRNKIVYDFAQHIRFEWSPNCQYVELYLNGEYRGLYLVTEKVEFGVNRLPLKPNSFNYLCTMDVLSRCQNHLNKEVVTQVGQGIRIRYPKNCNSAEWRRIASIIKDFDDALMKSDEAETYDTAWMKHADLDSWVRKYMIDEVFGNFDAGYASNFFYCSGNDQDYTIYGGPIWDYDGAINLNDVLPAANSFLVKRSWRSQSPNARSPWYNAMYKTPTFKKRVCEIYVSEFRPLLMDMDSIIEGLYFENEKAIYNNNVRWHKSLESEYVSSFGVRNYQDIIAYLKEKTAFLDAVWLNGQEMCFVQMEKYHDAEYTCYSVPKGQPFTINLPDTLALYDKTNGMQYKGEILNQDNVQFLIQKVQNGASSKVESSDFSVLNALKPYLLIIEMLGSFMLLLSIFLIVDYRLNKR